MYRPFDAFQPTGKCISVIGSGGKTSFLRYLSKRLPGTVILTTSTHIFPFPEFPLVDVAQMNREQALSERTKPLLEEIGQLRASRDELNRKADALREQLTRIPENK